MTKTVAMRCGLLVEDFDLYPRADVDAGHVSQIMDAITAGAELPPVVACSKSKRIVDGFHRCRAWRRVHGDDFEIQVILKDYKNEQELFIEAMQSNSAHGRNMTSYDRTHAMMIAERLEIAIESVASALNMTRDKIAAWRMERACKIDGTRRMQPLKMPIRHMAGHTMTKAQSEIVPKLGGNQQLFYVRQLRMLIDNDMLDRSNETLLKELRDLGVTISSRV